MNQLTEAAKAFINLIVHGHTRTALPVGSKSMVENFNLPFSSATIRNELAAMTALGYLRQPHTSAGRVPTEEGYRFCVSNLVQQTNLPATTRNTISHQFYQSPLGLDNWLKLAASVLAQQSQAASIVTAPHSNKISFKHLELLSTHAAQVLMVLVLMGGEVRQRIFALEEVLGQEALSRIAQRFNASFQDCDLEQVSSGAKDLSPSEMEIYAHLLDEMQLAANLVTGDVYLDGLNNVLAEPEFSQSEQALSPMRLLEERTLLNDVIQRTVMNEELGGVQVLIGGEGTWEELRDCSVILTQYGIPDQITGTIGVLGPMRIPYGHTISTVRYLGDLLSDLVSETMIE